VKFQSEEIPVVVDDGAARPARLTMVVILAMLVGILLTLIAAGAVLHYRQGVALDEQVSALRGELRKKDIALEEMQAQNATLAKHVKVLKGYSIASSIASSETAINAGSAAAVANGGEGSGSGPDAAAKKNVPPQTAVAPQARKTTAGGTGSAGTQDCNLVGKSADQQVATLQRCVSLIDSPQRQSTAMARRGG
jgi:hypothetical protein